MPPQRTASRFLHVSNRVVVPKPGEAPVAGGLDVLIASIPVDEKFRAGWDGGTYEDAGTEKASIEIHKGAGIHAVFPIGKSVSERFYASVSQQGKTEEEKTDVCNGVLWLVHHGLQPDPVSAQMRVAYKSVNKQFANETIALLDDKQLTAAERDVAGVIIHDYQLMGVGEEMRKQGYHGPLGFFLHIPFPDAASRSQLSKSDQKSFWGGLLAHDSIGFQSTSDRRNFLEFAQAEMGATLRPDGMLATGPDANGRSRLVHTDVNPAGIDPCKYENFNHDYTDPRLTELKDVVGKRDVIFGIGRGDLSKGWAEMQEGLKLLFTQKHELRHDTAVVLVIPQTRQGVQKYRDYRERYLTLAQEVNELTGGPKLTAAEKKAERDAGRIGFGGGAVILVEQPMSHEAVASFIRQPNVKVSATPSLAEGFGLVSPEAVASSHPDHPLAILIGEGSGASHTLGPAGAIIVNPRDPQSIADGLHRGLSLSLEERKAGHVLMMEVVERDTAAEWNRRLSSSLLSVPGQVLLLPAPRPKIDEPRVRANLEQNRRA